MKPNPFPFLAYLPLPGSPYWHLGIAGSLAAPLGLTSEDNAQQFCSLKMLEGSRLLFRKKPLPQRVL